MKSLALRLWHSPTFMTWGSLAARLLGMILVLPIVLVKFSPAEVAVWQLFVSMYTLLLMFDFGLAPTFSRLLSYARGGASLAELSDMRSARPTTQPQAATDHSTNLAKVLSTQRWLYARITLGITAFFAVVGTWALITPASHVGQPEQVWAAWALVLLSSAVGFWGNGYSAALQGMNQIAVTRRWEILFALGQITSSVVVLLLGGGLLELVAAAQLWLIAGAWRNRWLLRHLHPEIFEAKPRPTEAVMQGLWPAAWRSGVGVLMSQGIIQASGIIYGQLAAPAQLASYMLALRLITTVSQFSQAPFYSKLPQMALQYAQGQKGEQLQLAMRGMKLSHWVFMAGVLTVGYLATPLLELVGSKTPFVSSTLWWLMGAAFFVERLGAMYLQLYSTTNHIVWHIANGVTGALMLGLGSALFPQIGITALPLSMMLAYAGFYTWYAIYLARKAFHFHWLGFERRSAMLPVVTALVGITIYQVIVAGH
jgi:hypothetical protein